MSVSKQWRVYDTVPDEIRARFPDLPLPITTLLYNRGITDPAEADAFLDPQYERDLHDPFLFRDMRKAVERLIAAIQKGERITIHGDYDADGVDASALLYTTLKKLGANVHVFLPHRELDGYGLVMKTVEKLGEDGTKVLITCDCGIANRPEIARGNELGIDTIITDHHALPVRQAGMPPELPDAFATIHPLVPGETYPDKGLAGGGVAFKLAQGLLQQARITIPERCADIPVGWEKWLLDFAALSSVGDMVPLLGETRTLVRYGLVVMQKARRPGLKKMLERAGVLDPLGLRKPKEITSETLAFQMCPRINAAGRMRHAEDAFRLLVTEDEDEAEICAVALEALNKDRQKAVEKIMFEARNQIVMGEQDKKEVLIVHGAEWPAGLVGLVAGKLSEEFYRPTFALGKKEDGWVGSGRGIPEFHMMEALSSMPEMFVKYGGHPQACGFTVRHDAFDAFHEKMRGHATTVLSGLELIPTLWVDAEVRLSDINWELHGLLERFQPFGEKNREPRYLIKAAQVESAEAMGNEGKHLRLKLVDDGVRMKVVGWRFGEWATRLTRGDRIDLVCTIEINEWNGNRELQVKIHDLRKA